MAAIVHELSVCVYLRFQQTLAFSPSSRDNCLKTQNMFQSYAENISDAPWMY